MTEKRIIRISPSGLGRIQTCFRASHYNRVLGYEPAGLETYEPFVKGTLIHSSLEAYYRAVIQKEPRSNCVKAAVETIRSESEKTSLSSENKAHLLNTIIEYLAYYANDTYEPVGVEDPFSYELFEDENLVILLEGKIDLRMQRIQGEETVPFIFDHKSRGRDTTPQFLNNQYMAYALATNTPNVVDNQIGLQTSLKSKDKYKRRILTYSPEQLEEFAEIAISWVLLFDASVQRNQFLPNYTHCYQCDFSQVCESSKEFRLEKLERFFVKRSKDYDIFG